MNGKRAFAVAWIVGLFVLLVSLLPRTARAQNRTDFLITRLKFPPVSGVADDFRVRTNAALGLGAVSDDRERERVVTPLCQALADPIDVVRQSVAVALKRLNRPSAVTCLRNRSNIEGSAQVKLQLQRAIESIEADSGSTTPSHPGPSVDNWSPKNVPNARYYVAISPITNNTGRPQSEVERTVLATLRSKIESMGNYQMAPVKESAAEAKSTMSKRKMKGYYLAIQVERFDYSDGNLRVRLKCAVFDYPGKNLRGEVPAGLTQTGVRPNDHSAEESLMQMAAERAVELFAQNFQ
jgi:hypothetical protein